MENVKISDVILDKKMNGYNFCDKNFLATGELTVTITLDEYRMLVKEVATKEADINKANSDKWKRDSENEALRKEVAELKVKLYEQNMVKIEEA